MNEFDKKLNESKKIYTKDNISDMDQKIGNVGKILSKLADKGIGHSFKAVIKAPGAIKRTYKKFDRKMGDLEKRTEERGLFGLMKEDDDETSSDSDELDDIDTATVDSDIDNIKVVDLARRALFIDPDELKHYISIEQSEKLSKSVNNENVSDMKEIINSIINSSYNDVEIDSSGPGIQ